MIALLAGEALEVVDVRLGAHDHLEGGYGFVAGRAVARVSEEPQVVPPAEYEVGLRVEGRTDLAQSAVATVALQAVLVPVSVQRLQEVPGRDG